MFIVSNCDISKFNIYCSSIDKLDKEPWDIVKKELIEKGMNEDNSNILYE